MPARRPRTYLPSGLGQKPAECGEVHWCGYRPAFAAGSRRLVGREPCACRGVVLSGRGVMVVLPLIAAEFAVAAVAIPGCPLETGLLGLKPKHDSLAGRHDPVRGSGGDVD